MTDISTDVQPDAAAAAPEGAPEAAPGQGADVGTSSLYNLDSFPEEVRSQVEPIFKEFDGNVTKEFQKRAEALSAWKPYEDLGLREYAPEDIQHLLAFGQLASDDEKFKSWVTETAQSLGLLGEQPAEGEAPAEAAAPAEGEALTPERVQEMIAEARQSEQQAVAQQREQEEQIEQFALKIRSDLDALKEQHGEFDEDAVLTFASQHQGEDAINKGFERLMALIGKAETGVLQGKVDEAPTPEKGGRADATAQPPKTFAEAAARTRSRLDHAEGV